MVPYNIVEKQAEELIHKCAERGIGFIVMKPLAGGAIEETDLALRYCFANPDVSVVIPGMYDLKEIDMNLTAAENKAPLSEAELAQIQAVRIIHQQQCCHTALRSGQNIIIRKRRGGYKARHDQKIKPQSRPQHAFQLLIHLRRLLLWARSPY